MNTIAEYVAWRKAWRDNYKEKSELIRHTKYNIKKGMRLIESVWKEQWDLITFKKEATEMMVDRMIAKARAIELWAKEKGAG